MAHRTIDHSDQWPFELLNIGTNDHLEYRPFLQDRPWISPWIKSISNELDIIIHVIASQLSRYCDIISNRLWRHQQKKDRASEARRRCLKIVRNEIMYVISRRTVSAHTRMLFLCTKITIAWALKQFVTRVHTLFSMLCNRIILWAISEIETTEGIFASDNIWTTKSSSEKTRS